ncbi:potassium/sodium efflux P-type ATPase [Trichoderma harzianum]|uniref:Potassium/sodium efflux P-type ATPase n=1 Tax=Trichoderma harzianum TaxID=5544 RepID=A0A0F9XE24_TRIHA|nr:potassium/sodium efflux P-type ATPase [Trichoderma harzianum]
MRMLRYSYFMMTAQEFDALSHNQIDVVPQLPLVIARRNHYIPMTGDGINDNPNLKPAGIGIAIASGSDVAKEPTDIILTDNILTKLPFKDNTTISVFLSTPVEIIRTLPVTDAFSESGLGFETTVPDILNRLPRDTKLTPTLPQINTSTETPS